MSMKKRMMDAIGENSLNEGTEIDVLYKHLRMVPSFKNLGMDRQGELSIKILKLIKKG